MRPMLAVLLAAPLLAACTAYDDYGYQPGYPTPGYGHGGYAQGYGAVSVRSIDDFYGPLSAHGLWRAHPRLGRVFIPRVAAGWQPYTLGRWDAFGGGQRWISDEPFGWATYHYGRWAFDAGFGWLWVPDTRWGPGWVDWREADGFYGWSPLAPFGWSNAGLSAGFGWTWASRDHLYRPQVWRYAVPRDRAAGFWNRGRQPQWGNWQGGQPNWQRLGRQGQGFQNRPNWQRPARPDFGNDPAARERWQQQREARRERRDAQPGAPAQPGWQGGRGLNDGLRQERQEWRAQRRAARPGQRADAGQPVPADPVARSAPGIARDPNWPNPGGPRWQTPPAEIAQSGLAPQSQRFNPPPVFSAPPRPEPRPVPRMEAPRMEAPRPEPRPEPRIERPAERMREIPGRQPQ